MTRLLPTERPPVRVNVVKNPRGFSVFLLLLSKHLFRLFDYRRLAERNEWVLFFGYGDADCQHGVTGTRHEVDESPEDTMHREVHEETGMKVTGPYPPYWYTQKDWQKFRVFNVHASSLESSDELPTRLSKAGDMKKDKVAVTIHGPEDLVVQKAHEMAAALARPGANPDGIGYIVAISARDALFTIEEIEHRGRGRNVVEVNIRDNPMVRRPAQPELEERVSPSKRRAESDPEDTPSPSKRGRT